MANITFKRIEKEFIVQVKESLIWMSDLPEKYIFGIQCFNQGDYFECHEQLEALWLEAGGLHEIFYQALIQAAVSIYHLEGNNGWGATSLYKACLEKLSKIPDRFMCLDVRLFENSLINFYKPYLLLERGSEILIDQTRVPKIELI